MFLGIDLGSTSVKAALYDAGGNVVVQSAVAMRRFHPNPDHPEWTVWDPDALWQDVALVCRNVVQAIGDASQIQAVAATGMGMDGLPMTEDGKALYPFISWHDPRTAPQFDWWIKNIGEKKTYSIGGNPVWTINSALRMLWIKENEPRIFAETFKWLLIEDFINFKLTGRFATDYSMASCTMLFDQKKRNWSEELCRLSGIPISILPEASPSSTFLGTVNASAAATGLKEGTPVFLGGHDHICSSLPIGAFREGNVMNITGTWETIGLVSTSPPVDVPLGENGIMTQSNVLADRYMIWGGNPAGEMLEWYRRAVAVEAGKNDSLLPDWNVLIPLAESAPPGSGGVMFLPHLDGCQCPWVDPYSRGTFIGLNTRTSHQELLRSVIEGLGYQILTVIRVMESSLGMKATEVVATGGAVRNRFWMQNKADATGLRVRIPAVEEATVLGAAMLAGIGVGMYRDAEDAFARVCKTSEIFEPNEDRTAFYQERFPLFQELYAAVSPLHRRMG
ncbi:MAG: hypothetical protein LBT05_02830 [Planctomycetaceae bacterium]|jgi:xylulokinase|nr:hypothetical protein [Planctomycetaceae bacterium]